MGDTYDLMIYPIGSMYAIYGNIGGILMVNVTIYSIHGSYGYIYIYPILSRLENVGTARLHLGFGCLPQELRWRARGEAPAGCTGEQLYLADAGPPEVVIYIYIWVNFYG